MIGQTTVKLPIKDTPKEDKPPNKGQVKSTLVYSLYKKSPLKENNLFTKDKMAGPNCVLIKRFQLSAVVVSKWVAYINWDSIHLVGASLSSEN